MKWKIKLRIDRGNAILKDYGFFGYYNVDLSRDFWEIQKSGKYNCRVLSHLDISDSFFVYLSYIDQKWKLEVIHGQEECWNSQTFEL